MRLKIERVMVAKAMVQQQRIVNVSVAAGLPIRRKIVESSSSKEEVEKEKLRRENVTNARGKDISRRIAEASRLKCMFWLVPVESSKPEPVKAYRMLKVGAGEQRDN